MSRHKDLNYVSRQLFILVNLIAITSALNIIEYNVNKPCGNIPKPKCPIHDENGPAVHLPHPTDCSKFFQCDWEVLYPKDCPDGLHFNAVLEVCDWPQDAGCTCSSPPDPIEPEPPVPPCGNIPKPVCPPHDENGLAVHLPDPEDCTKFYQCDWEVLYHKKCPGGLHFNAVLQVCDWPNDAGCICTGATSPKPTTEPETTAGPCTPNPDPVCPPHDVNGPAVHLPHQTDCTRFYQCDWGVAYPKVCPAGLHFNKILQVCDWPRDAGCDCSNPNPQPTTTARPTEPPCEVIPEPICPPHDVNGPAVHLPDPEDCNKFYQCDWEVPYHKSCPGGLHFNRNLQVCDWPKDAGCSCSATTSQGTTQAETTPAPCSPNPAPVCPPHDVNGPAVHLPHENDCTRFYQCDWGVAYPKVCPAGLHFNKVLQVCDWPKDAGCDCSIPTNPPPTTTPGPSVPPCNAIPEPKCPPHDVNGPAVHLPDPNDCTKFYQCDWEVLYHKSCPANLHFNAVLQVCDWPKDAGCICTEATSPKPTEEPEPTSGPCTPNSAPVCPPHDENGLAVHLPHETDCTRFYQCDWGVAYPKVCPGGLHFNKVLQVCDWPKDAGCDCSIPTNPPPTTTPGPSVPPCNAIPEPKCPPHDVNGPAVHLPDPNDCTKFYQCDWEVLYHKSCPANLHFNAVLQVCDWPKDAGCICTEATSPKPTEEPEPTSGPCTPNSAPVCPPHDENGLAVHLPHETDCTRFYQCDWGVAYPKVCPGGLHFNKVLQVCDWPKDAGCDCSIPTNPPPTTTPGPSVPPCNAIPEPKCPPHDVNGPAVHLPDPNDCTKFYQCDWEVLYHKSCPANLHFNAVLQVCDWPKDAGCICTEATSPKPTEEPEPTSGPCTPNSAPVCPPHDENGLAVHLPHETDCTRFYQCDWGVAYPKVCPGGLHFNKVLQVCDWPKDAGCDCSIPTNPPPTTTPGPSVPPCNAIPEPKCPPHDVNGPAVHLPDPNDCTKFYQCDWEVLYHKSCPANLHFNAVLQVCDWPKDAGCICTEATSPKPTEEPEPTSGPCTPNSAPVCPPHDENGLAVHLPHETDCTRFYQCDWGVAYPKVCPGGLHFNKVLQVCDWPKDAGCDCSIPTNPPPTTTPGPSVPPCNAIPEPKCPPHDVNGPAVHLPDPNDCTKFYQCDWEVLYHKSCPANLHFNAVLQVCDWPKDAGCICTEATSPKPTEEPEPTSGPCTPNSAPVCPPHDENGLAVHLPHETDCTRFYQCDWGVAYPKVCPGGLHFNKVLQVCDWPKDAGCDCSIPTNPPPTTTPGPSVPPCNAIPEPKCPPHDVNGPAVHLPDPNDCTKFYQCDWEVLYHKSCPANLHFNAVLQVCDWPKDAGCICTEATSPKPTEEPEPTSGPCTPNSAPVCPPHDENGLAVHLPHETDCTRFYQCDWGVAYPKVCPGGLHFNKVLQVCDWPKDAGCDCSIPTNPPPTTTPGPSVPPCNAIPEPKCPPHDVNGPAVHLPDPNDCTKFYQCDWEVLYHKSCPANLHFNAVLQVCDWPKDAGCICTEATSPKPTEEPEPTSGPCTPNSAPVCPPHDENGLAVHLPHETDCTRFYQCDWGVAYPKVCPGGLHFNKVLQVCDWPKDAGCDCSIPTNPPPTTTPGPSVPPCNAIPEPKCPPHDVNGPAVHLPDPNDCTKFYQCDWEVLYHKSCPANLHFNAVLQVCDWPKDAGCICTEATSPKPTEEPEPTSGPCTPNSAPVCPPHDENGLAVHLPHETDCTRFYQCDWGVAYPKVCPGGLHFNKVLQVCDWPKDAGCDCSIPTNPPPTTTPGPSVPPCNAIPEPKCPPHDVNGPAVHLPDPNDCTKFYQCDWEVLYHKSCPANLHFNAVLQVCDWPKDAGCICTEATSPKPTEEPEPTSGPCTPNSAPVCPPHDENGLAVHLPHETDCTRFYQCDWGVAYPKVCPGGLHFNKVLQVCDWPKDAGCDCSIPTNPPPTTTPGPSVPPCNAIPEPKCPPHDVNGPAVHLPDPNDCTKFYQCDWEVLYHKSCPANLHFNAVLQVCDWPKDAGCICTEATSPKPTEEPEPTSGPCTPNSAPVCPPHDENGLAVHLPHETDCTRFYQCDWGVAYPKVCPGGLHFNKVLQVCDWPKDAGCDCSIPTNPPPTTTPGPSVPPCNAIPEPKCPPHDVNGPAVHLPDPNDCTKFYQCDWEVLYHKSCPANLHFNAVLQVCDWPKDAGCICTEATSPKPTEEPEPTSGPCTPNSAPVCPPHDENGLAVHLPHETDCTRFYQCDWGVAYPKVCPGGLHFNKVLQVCDWPKDAGCDCTIPTNPPPTTTPGPSVAPCNEIPEPKCPPHDENGLAVHLPDPKDCTKFYHCDWEVAYHKSCPAGLHFNAALQVCDWPNAAGCICVAETTPSIIDPPCRSFSEPICPPHDVNGPAVHLPHPSDCTRFYQCDWGVAYPKLCPSGLHFNADLQVCDWPKDAGCSCSFTTSKPVETTTPVTPCKTFSTPVCPPHDENGPAVHLPDPEDCAKFYYCDWGVLYSRDCPFGLHFNSELEVCDWPESAQCECKANNKI